MPYTRGLLGSIPGESVVGVDGRLATIPGNVPNPVALPPGCPFHPRCAWARTSLCDTSEPPMEEAGRNHHVRCLRWREVEREAVPVAREAVS